MKFYGKDIRRFLSKWTFRKAWNATRVLASFYATRLSGRPVVWGLPVTVSIEPTTACNLRCPECPSGLRQFTRPTGNLRADFFRNVIDELGRDLTYLIFYFQGEPFINPGFLDMVRYASDRRIYTITSTNGHFLDPENARRTVASGLDRLIISIDGATQEVYEQYRVGGNLQKVLDGARNIVAAREEAGSTTPHLIFQFLVVRPNEHQIDEVRRLAEEIGVDEVRLKTAQVYDYEHGNPLIPTIGRYSRYIQHPDGTWSPRHRLVNRCWKLWHAAMITWDGKVLPCCFDKDARHVLGDMKARSFRYIWKSKAYDSFRRQVLRGRSEVDICQNCSEGCTVWA